MSGRQRAATAKLRAAVTREGKGVGEEDRKEHRAVTHKDPSSDPKEAGVCIRGPVGEQESCQAICR